MDKHLKIMKMVFEHVVDQLTDDFPHRDIVTVMDEIDWDQYDKMLSDDVVEVTQEQYDIISKCDAIDMTRFVVKSTTDEMTYEVQIDGHPQIAMTFTDGEIKIIKTLINKECHRIGSGPCPAPLSLCTLLKRFDR